MLASQQPRSNDRTCPLAAYSEIVNPFIPFNLTKHNTTRPSVCHSNKQSFPSFLLSPTITLGKSTTPVSNFNGRRVSDLTASEIGYSKIKLPELWSSCRGIAHDLLGSRRIFPLHRNIIDQVIRPFRFRSSCDTRVSSEFLILCAAEKQLQSPSPTLPANKSPPREKKPTPIHQRASPIALKFLR